MLGYHAPVQKWSFNSEKKIQKFPMRACIFLPLFQRIILFDHKMSKFEVANF